MNNKEQKLLLVFNELMVRRMMGQEAADLLGITLRHTRRLLAAYRRTGIHFTYWRTVARDHTISLFGHVLTLLPLPVRQNLAGRTVAVHYRMNDRLAVVYQDQLLGLLQPAELGPPCLEQLVLAPQHLATRPIATPPPSSGTSGSPTEQPRPNSKPAADQPWRRSYDQDANI